jgi:hypothetical protein
MDKEKTNLFAVFFIAILMVYTVTLSLANAGEAKAKHLQVQPGNNDTEFIFAGRCMNGESYRIYSYEKNIDGAVKSFYDYEGPAGKGTVITSASPKTVAERICRHSAEIANGS